MPDELTEQRRVLRLSSRSLHGHGSVSQTEELRRITTWCDERDIEPDVYGEGAALQEFEQKVADLLGYEEGRYFPSGTMAQSIALRVWSDRADSNLIGMHPTCHLELHEELGYRHLHGLNAEMIGQPQLPLLAEDLAATSSKLSVVIVELPTRENGGQLPPWANLLQFSEAARSRNIRMHLDGARLWEAQASYGRPFHEIAALFDSVYVSFYKGIGALSGSMLLGPSSFMKEAIIWQRRQGGNLYSLLPNWASAAMRLDDSLQRFSLYRDYAVDIAAELSAIEGITVIPEVPQTSMFHLELAVGPEAAQVARDEVARAMGLWLFGGVQDAESDTTRTEISIGDSALAVDPGEFVAAFRDLMAKVSSSE